MFYLIGYAETAERKVAVWRGNGVYVGGKHYVTDPNPPMMDDGVPVGLRPAPYAIHKAASGDIEHRVNVNWINPNS